MKKIILIMILFSLLLSGCSELSNQSPRSVTENIGSRTCTGKGVDKIEGYANCNRNDGWTYVGDIRGHKFNGKGKLVTSDGEIWDGYFYSGNIIAGKVTKSNGNAIKGLWRGDGNSNSLELGKIFQKNGDIKIGEFDDDGNITYGLSYENILNTSIYVVGKFPDNLLKTELFFIAPDGCAKFSNGEYKEITRTITNTVYRNNNIISSPKNLLGEPGSISNPYRVELTVK